MTQTSRHAAGVRHWMIVLVGALCVLALMALPMIVQPHRRLPVLGIVALGDSVPSGYACDCTAFPELLGDDLAGTGRSVAVYNQAANGYTVADVATQVQTKDLVRRWISQSDLVTLTVGANALEPAAEKGPEQCPKSCWQPMVDQNAVQLGKLVRTLRDLQRDHHGKLVWTTYWDVFEDGDQGREVRGDAFVAWSDQVTRYANEVYSKTVKANGGEVVDLYAPFKGIDGNRNPSELLSADGNHPNADGHQLIATTIERAVGLDG